MGLLDYIFKPRNDLIEVNEQFKVLNGYTPAFTSYTGGLYEMDLIRSAIHAKARLIGKLKPEIKGNAYKNLEKVLQYKPNDFMNTYQFLYRISTILDVNNTCFIIPLYDDREFETVIGFYPVKADGAEVLQKNNKLYIKYRFVNEYRIIEWDRVGILYKNSYKSDFFGDSQTALDSIIKVLDIQNQGMIEAVKSSANLRFMAKLSSVMRPEDMQKERKRFSEDNLSSANHSGVLLFDKKYDEIKQIDSKPYLVDEKQMELIKKNVYSYFGVSENIIQSKYSEDEFNAFYESEIESFALQLGLTLTNMLFTSKELAHKNEVIFTANRLQYASNQTKLEIINSGLDRGWLNANEVREIMQLGTIDNGDKYHIRLEYAEVDNLSKVQGAEDEQ